MASNSVCDLFGVNTGGLKCDPSKGIVDRLFMFNGSFDSTTAGDPTTFSNNMIAYAKLGRNNINKVVPLPIALDIADSSEANKEGTLGLGYKEVLIEGLPVYTIKARVSNEQIKQLRKLNGKIVRVLECDRDMNIWGTSLQDKFVGYQAKLFFGGLKGNTGQNVEKGIVTFTLSFIDTFEYFDNSFYMPFIGNINDVAGLLDFQLSESAPNTTNTYKLVAKIETSQYNVFKSMYEDYGDAFEDEALWNAKSGATNIPVTSVAKDAVNEGWTIVLDSAAFTALPSGAKIVIATAEPEVLDAADINGYEGISVIVTK